MRARSRTTVTVVMFTLVASSGLHASPDDRLVVSEVAPSLADPSISQFNQPNYVVAADTSHAPPLVLFLPGTGGKPGNSAELLSSVAKLGYRVIGLTYNDTPAVVAVCPRNPSPACSEDMRGERSFGNTGSVVTNTASESIVSRFAHLLQYLDAHDSGAGWGEYLKDGEPNWPRIVVSGLSQGAGMAAYIAKKRPVARVVLFSSPWDYFGPRKQPAPWLSEPSLTPPELWFAEYHRRENTADLIIQAYSALKIPPKNIVVFNLDLEGNHRSKGPNPYHVSTVRDVRYLEQWEFLFGHPQ